MTAYVGGGEEVTSVSMDSTCNYNAWVRELWNYVTAMKTSVQAGAVLMPLAMFLLSLKSIRVLSIMNFILKLAYLYKVTEKKRLIYMHLL